MIEKELKRIADSLETFVQMSGKAYQQLAKDIEKPSEQLPTTSPQTTAPIPEQPPKTPNTVTQDPDFSDISVFINYMMTAQSIMEKKGTPGVLGDTLQEFGYSTVYDVTPEDRIKLYHQVEAMKG